MAKDLSQLLETLGAGAALAAVSPHWEESQACYPAQLPDFLDPRRITEQRAFARFPDHLDEPLHAAAARVAASPPLRHLAWHLCRLLYQHLEYDAAGLSQWPQLTQVLGPLSGTFYLLIALDAVRRTRAVHQRLGIPEHITRADFGQIMASTEYYAMHHRQAAVGVLPQMMPWLRNHVQGHLYRLGRLDYMLKPFHGELKAWRHKRSGQVQALAVEGIYFDAQGLRSGPEDSGAWQAHLRPDRHGVTGTPISPRGRAWPRQVRLAADTWDLVLSPGDTVLETHIPSGGNMSLEHCRASMAQALEFFPQHFPESPFAGFACGSWILNPQLEWIYHAESNMVKWQRELYLFPISSGDRDGLYFVFGEADPDLRTAPRDTSLRRALLEHLEGGGRLISGGMFLLTEDFSEFGSQFYRRGEGGKDAELASAAAAESRGGTP